MNEFSVNIGPKLARQAGLAPQVTSAIVPDPPREVRALDSGTILKGVVQGRDPDGLTVIATDKGTIRVAVSPAPAPGTSVTLEVRIAGDRLQVLILASDPPATASAKSTDSAPGPSHGSSGSTNAPDKGPASSPLPAVKPSASTPPPAVVTQTGALVEAIIVKADPEALRLLLSEAQNDPNNRAPSALGKDAGLGQPPVQGAASAQGGAPRSLPTALASALGLELRARIDALFTQHGGAAANAQSLAPGQSGVGAQPGQPFAAPRSDAEVPLGRPNQGAFAPLASTTTVGASLEAAQAAASRSALGANSPWSLLPNGAEVKIKVTLQPDAAPGTHGNAAAHVVAGSIDGRIVGHTANGATIVAGPFGAIIIKRDLSLPAGARVTLTLEPGQAPILNPVATPATPMTAQQALLQASRGWFSLAEAIASLRAHPTDGAYADPIQRLPQPGPRLAADIMRAMRAIERADLEAILGPAIRQRRAPLSGKDEVFARLRQEIGQLSQFAGEKGQSEWKCYFLPIWDESLVRQINFFYRRDRGNKPGREDGEEKGARFVVDVDFTRLGAFQFDGLVRKRRFDLVVRSRVAMPAEMKRDIGALFQEALELGQYKGEIGFQTVRDFPVAPLDDIARRATAVSA